MIEAWPTKDQMRLKSTEILKILKIKKIQWASDLSIYALKVTLNDGTDSGENFGMAKMCNYEFEFRDDFVCSMVEINSGTNKDFFEIKFFENIEDAKQRVVLHISST